MSQPFDDELLNVILKFANPNKGEMVEADKIAGKMALSMDSVIRKSIAAGKAVGEVFDRISQLEPALKSLEKRAGGIGSQASAIRTAQQTLSRYTPDRLERMAESAASRIAETSGTSALRKQLEQHGDLIKRLVATQEGRYDRTSRGSSIGRGLYVDAETTGLNALKHQIVELTATLFSFNKQTGEIINAAEKTYHGFQQLAYQSKHQYIPGGLSASQLQGQAISTSQMRRLLQQSDFLVAHNAPFDKKFIEKIVPQAASMQWLDSMRGVQWKNQGFSSRALQDLLRAHGIGSGTAHRSSADVQSGIQLLGSRSPLGGPTYLNQLLGSQGPLNKAQQTLALIKQTAEETRSSLQQRLGDGGRSNFPRPTAQYTAQLKNYASRAADDVAEIFSNYVVTAIEGGITARARRPARSTDYGIKQGSGQTAETTPGLLGESAIHLDRSLATAEEFIRNLSIMSGPGSATKLVSLYNSQSSYQEGIQRSRGRTVQRKIDVRTGDDLHLSTMTGVNTQLRNERMGTVSSRLIDDRLDSLFKKQYDSKQDEIKLMLGQSWAKPTSGFTRDQIDGFIAQHKDSSSTESIRTAAQMASHVGPAHPSFQTLAGIMLSGQEVGRRVASAQAVKKQQDLMNRLASGQTPGKKSGFRNVISSALGQMTDAGLAGAHTLMSPFTSSGGIGFGGFSDFLKFFSSRRQASQGGRSQSYEERAQGDIPEASTLRGSIRRDALETKLKRLEDAVDQTTKSFERYKTVTEPIRKQESAVRYGAREFGIQQTLDKSNLSADAQLRSVQFRREALRRSTATRLQGVQSGFDERSSALGFGELDAETQYENALARQKIRTAALRKSKAYKEGNLKPADIEAITSAPVRTAQMKLIRARYTSQVSQLVDPDEIEKLRSNTAAEYAMTKYGAGGGPQLDKIREEYSKRVSNLLVGPTLSEKNIAKTGQIAQTQIASEKELDQRESDIGSRRAQAFAKAEQSRTVSAAKAEADIAKINAEGEKKYEQVLKKKADADKKITQEKITYLKKEDATGGGGGGGSSASGGSGGGSGSGSSRNFASREGFDFGIGLAGLAAYGTAMESLIKDSAIYAARTQTLELVTRQMAQANGLNVKAVEDEVSAMTRMNVTAQDANTVVQKMMFSQLDVAKATDLARTAQNASVLANVSASEALERIILGISTGQTRVLHNMGLQVSMVSTMRELKQDRSAAGIKGEPTEYEKRQAMLGKVLVEGAKITGTYEKSLTTAGGQFNLLSKDVQGAKNAIGSEFLPVFGQAISSLGSGLHFVEEHSSAFAKLASVIISVTAAAGVLGTASFAKWASVLPIPWWAKLGGAAVAGGVYTYLNQDKAGALTSTSNTASGELKKQIDDLNNERKELLANKQDTPEWKNTLAVNTQALASAAESQKSITQELTAQLADQYNKRIKDLDDYIAAMEGKSGVLSQYAAAGKGSPETSWIGSLLRNIPGLGQTGSEDLEEARRQRAALANKLSTGNISSADIVNEAQHQKDEAARRKLLSPSIVNRERAEAQTLAGQMSYAQSEMLKLDERLGDSGSFNLKAKKMMGSPRQKVELDYDEQTSKFTSLASTLTDLKAKAAGGDISAKSKLAAAGVDKVNEFLAVQNKLIEASAEDRDIALGKINNANQAQIAQINEEIDLEKIRANTVQGSYASELAAIDAVSKRRMQTVRQVAGLTQDTDAARKESAQVQAQAATDRIKLKADQDKYYRESHVSALQQEADVRARGILNAPGDEATALRGAFKVRFDATSSITDDKKRTDEQLKLIFELDDAFIKLANDKKLALAEKSISVFTDAQELQSEIDRIVSTRHGLGAKGEGRRSDQQRALDEIERTRQSQIAVANKTYTELSPVRPAAAQEDLIAQRDEAIRQADKQADLATVKQREQNVDAARTRLTDTYSKQYQTVSAINEMSAAGAAEEQDAALNNHKLRLQYIEKEYEARGKSLEAERIKNEEVQQADFERLQELLAQRKKDIEGLRSFAGSLFDIITSKTPNRTREARAFGIGEAKNIGRTMVENLTTEIFKGSIGTLGNVLPGQETRDAQGNIKPTLWGKILGGTPFGKTHFDEIPKLQAEATKANTKAEDDLRKAIEHLDKTIADIKEKLGGGKAVEQAGGSVSNSDVNNITLMNKGILPTLFGPSAASNASSLFKSFSPMVGGSSSNNPFIFNFGSGSKPVVATGSGGGMSVPAGIVSSALNFGAGPISTGPGTIYSGSSGGGGSVTLDLGGGGGSGGGGGISLNLGGYSPLGSASSTVSYPGFGGGGGGFSLGGGFSPGLGSADYTGPIPGIGSGPFAIPGGGSFNGGSVFSGGAPGGLTPIDLSNIMSGPLPSSDISSYLPSSTGGGGSTGSLGGSSLINSIAGVAGALAGAPGSAVPKDIKATAGLLSGLGKLSGPLGLGGGGGGSDAINPFGMGDISKSPSNLGGILAGAGMALGGGYQAYNGFSRGGVSGIASGVGGALTAAAGITSMIPGAQIATPFLMAGGLVSDFVGSIFGSSRQQRGYDIQNYLNANKYIAPVALNSTQSLSGNMISYNAEGIARDSGISAFPIDSTPTQYGKTPSKTWADPNVPEYYTIPGQINYSNLPANANPVNYNVSLPISAMDSKDVIARSGDIAAALKKELNLGSDVAVSIQNAVFGVS